MRPCRTAGGIRQPRARSGAVQPQALTARGKNGRVLAKRCEKHIFASAKRGMAQAFPLFAFLGLTILYERKNLLGDNFCDVL